MSGVTVQLVERASHLATLAHVLEESAVTGQLALISGEAGAGKSALVQAFLDEHADVRTLVGHCDDLFVPRPLGPFADMARTSAGPLSRAIGSENAAAAFDAVLAELAAPPHPIVVVLDDVQWADEATLDLLRFVVRRLDTLHCLVVVTHRVEIAVDHPLRRAIGALVGPNVIRLTVPPLSLEAVCSLAAGSGVDALALHSRTGGNAFFVNELLAAEPGRLPATVSDSILGRAALLSRPARDALEATAVLGRQAEIELICTVAGCAPLMLDECVEVGLLVGDHRTLAFRHDLSREAIELALTPLRRRELHARALAALEPSGDLVQLAHHAIGAGDSTRIVDLAGRAAQHCVALGAYREAARLFGSALEHVDTMSPERLRLLEGRARICERVEQFDAAIEAGEEVVALYADERSKGKWEAWLGGVCRCAGRSADAWTLLTRSVDRLDALGESIDLARALGLLSQHQMVSSRNVEAITTGQRALEMAERLGADDVAVHVLDTLGSAVACSGDDTGLDLLIAAIDRARRGGIHHEITRSTENLADALLVRYRAAEALEHIDQAIDIATELELRFSRNSLLNVRAAALLLVGRWDDAAAWARAVLAEHELAPTNRSSALKVLGTIRARRGDPEATEALDEALALALPYAEPQLIVPMRLARAEAAWLAGDDAALEREVRGALSYVDGSERWYVGGVALWCWRAGIHWQARVPLPDQFALMLAGDARAAATAWQALGCHYEAADALADSREASDLRESLEQLTALGAHPRALQVARSLRHLGEREIPRGPRATTRANRAGLTAREMEIAALVASGLANSDIAARLVLSPKTVDHHVSSVLAKLAVPSRRHVGAAAIALGVDLQVEGTAGPR